MNKSRNHGIYAELIARYIDHKRSLGFKMEDTKERLRRFDRLTIDRGESSIGISKDLFDAWSCPFPLESECTRSGRVSILKGFSAYLQLMGYDSYVPPRNPKYRSTFTPHIYTKQEMAAIFRECDKMTVCRHYMHSSKCVMPVLVRVLYGTGIRIGEAVRLTHGDVDLDIGVLTLHECKNGQDRIVPMSLSLREVCKDYVAFKLSLGLGVGRLDTFFTAADGRPCHPSTVYEHFRAILHRAGIGHGGRSKGPRLHDLRHTFCVNALVKMSEAGQDLYYSMPVLMTYMGHKTLAATNRYVRITQEMYPGLLKQVDEAYKYVFPEIGVSLEEEDGL